MDNLTIINQNGKDIQMTSLDLAEITGKEHKHIMRDIRNEIEALGNINEPIFGLVDYTDAKGEKRPCYTFGRKGAMQLALKYDAKTRFRVIERIEELEVKNKPKSSAEMLLIYAQQFYEQEKRLTEIEEKANAVETGMKTLVTGLTEKPNPSKVTDLVNEYVRWTRLGYNEVYNKVYSVLKAQYGIDVLQRVENERQRLNEEQFKKTGKYYAAATLKNKVNGIDVMARMGVLDKFYRILVGMMAEVKSQNLVSK